MAKTGTPILDHALDDLRSSRYCLWLGDSHRILKNCVWVTGEQSYSATLQWKEDAPSKLEHDEGDAIFGFLGTVSVTALNVGPEGGWQETYGESKIIKQKRNFRLVVPPASSDISPHFWKTQFEGATRLVEEGCKPAKSKSYEVTHCFANKEGGFLRVRSPLFMLGNGAADNDAEEDTNPGSSSEEGVPQSCKFDTWILSPNTQEAFERVIEQGYEPQVLEAHDREDKLIHPNNVASTLSGAIVVVYCTLERIRFPRNNGRNAEFQFYANLVKVQVVKNAPPSTTTTAGTKRKFLHGYSQSAQFEADYRANSAKKMKFTNATD
ncbi:hypothetical protein FRC12_002662 [Ceratobasidium sp. 428]|nr:hypothetical protein FRC12_002662 [Ceratobasidium sp. 428]